jgi:hypothetical protein
VEVYELDCGRAWGELGVEAACGTTRSAILDWRDGAAGAGTGASFWSVSCSIFGFFLLAVSGLSFSFMVLGFLGLRSFTSFWSFASSGSFSFFLRCLLALAGCGGAAGGSAWLESVTVAGASSVLFWFILLSFLMGGVRMPSKSESEAACDKGDDEKSTRSALCSGAVMVAWSVTP